MHGKYTHATNVTLTAQIKRLDN